MCLPGHDFICSIWILNFLNDALLADHLKFDFDFALTLMDKKKKVARKRSWPHVDYASCWTELDREIYSDPSIPY